jgi:hypothetical protein
VSGCLGGAAKQGKPDQREGNDGEDGSPAIGREEAQGRAEPKEEAGHEDAQRAGETETAIGELRQ